MPSSTSYIWYPRSESKEVTVALEMRKKQMLTDVHLRLTGKQYDLITFDQR